MKSYWKIQLILFLFGIRVSKTTLMEVYLKQFKKGLDKYGHTLQDCPEDAFNWQEMAIEEIVDFIQYINKIKSIKNGKYNII